MKEIYFESLHAGEIDQVICVDELKLNLLAKTCLCPGINTIIAFLITSSKSQYDTDEYESNNTEWIHDYLYGM
jgi:potassium large conductance calcium-activated channel subfamily M alpha protein 1